MYERVELIWFEVISGPNRAFNDIEECRKAMYRYVIILHFTFYKKLFFTLIGIGSNKHPGISCLHILNETKNELKLKSGYYWILLKSTAVEVFCDMETYDGKFKYVAIIQGKGIKSK